ncbi:MAG: hypothetical protein L6Q33_16035, partial [Bacteriovoracaceae bacterium]|nr:hypothetical protein [Bacteriovoracaceae bacterium]
INESKNGFQKTLSHELISNPIKEFIDGIGHFRDSRYVIPMLSYAFLWLSILSPHGVLLTSYLKDNAKLSEIQISFFRGGGALFGLLPTLIYAPLRKKLGLNKAAKFFLAQQLIFVLSSCVFFFLPFSFSIWGFLLMILISRIGLYGFSIAESEARQVFIPTVIRGRINGVGVSLTSLATLTLFFLGTFLPSSKSFTIMVCFSTGAVGIAFAILLFWKEPFSKPQN